MKQPWMTQIFAIMMIATTANALETDPFVPPPAPLVDIGPLTSIKVYETLSKIIADLPSTSETPKIASENLYKALGHGLPTCPIEKWLNKSPEIPVNARFAPTYKESAYNGVFSPLPGGLRFVAPTIQMFGIYHGTDKWGHFFQQGRTYFQNYQIMIATGVSQNVALEKIVEIGTALEGGYFGTHIDGVFSNADLSANLAGFTFYMSLTQPISLNGKEFPQILVLEKDKWRINPSIDPTKLLEPFVSQHFDELLNPSQFRYSIPKLRTNVKALCTKIREHLLTSGRASQFTNAESFRRWNGMYYGQWIDDTRTVSFEKDCTNGKEKL
jgi:hypothetical protein